MRRVALSVVLVLSMSTHAFADVDDLAKVGDWISAIEEIFHITDNTVKKVKDPGPPKPTSKQPPADNATDTK